MSLLTYNNTIFCVMAPKKKTRRKEKLNQSSDIFVASASNCNACNHSRVQVSITGLNEPFETQRLLRCAPIDHVRSLLSSRMTERAENYSKV